MALNILTNLIDGFPAVIDYQVDLAGSYCNYGHLLRDTGNPTDSLTWFDKAISTLNILHRKEPRLEKSGFFLRNSFAGRAQAYDLLEKHAEAVKDWNRAIELSPPWEQVGTRVQRANSCVRMGRIASAVAEVAELTKAGTWDAVQRYNFACIYAVAAGKDAGKKQEYADRAMELLHRAVKAGYKEAAHMAKDKDLDVLRQLEDFKKLMEELGNSKVRKQAEGEAKKK
jgi:tetratricopeptide (TPR) repeat protein